jgi:DNA-binding transcriptional ArsR family regulator
MGERTPCVPDTAAIPTFESSTHAVRLLSAMAHPIRVRALLVLRRRGPMSVGELGEALEVEQSALSHQLRRLRDEHLVVGERDGKRVIYRLADEHVGHIVEDALAHAAEAKNGGRP